MLLCALAVEPDQRTGVAGADDARRDCGLDRRAAGEQPQRLRDRDSVLADALGDLFVREAKLFGQAAKAARFFYGVEVGALQVLDESEHELLVVAGVAAHDGGHGGQTGKPGCAPPAFTGDQLVAVGQLSHEERLKHAVQPDGFGQLAQRLRVEPRADLLVRGLDLVHRDHLRHQCLPFTGHGDQGLESATKTAQA